MEVHAHTHSPRKKWTHYFWEFLMLFLAVTLGFFVENQREHYIERHRAKEYAKALLEDLAKDTTEIFYVIREDKLILTCFDSISAIVQKGIKDNMVPGSFYYYATIGTAVATVVWNNTTLTQITQSGNLRYFTNPELIRKISLYYSISDYISNLNDNDKRYREKSMDLRNRVLNTFIFRRYSSYNLSGWLKVPDSLMKPMVPIQNADAMLLNEFVNTFETRRSSLGLTINGPYPIALNTAKELMALLRREYNLE
jgi:hypothetical protein